MRTMAAVALVAAGLAGCSIGDDLKASDAATSTFHAQLNAGQFDAIYAAATPKLKSVTNETAFAQLLAAVHRKLGAFQSTRRQTFNDNLTSSGHLLTVAYASTYAGGQATETFMYRLGPSGAILSGYNISSPALILN